MYEADDEALATELARRQVEAEKVVAKQRDKQEKEGGQPRSGAGDKWRDAHSAMAEQCRTLSHE